MADPVASNGLKTLTIAFKYVPFGVCPKYSVGNDFGADDSFFTMGKIFNWVSTLLLVLVVDTLFSPAKLKVPLIWGSEVILNLSNMPILIAVSFLLGSSHRPLWNLIERST